MIAKKTNIAGCLEIHPRIFDDQRGRFVKTFHRELFQRLGLSTDYAEEYYTISRQRVLRGLHFQTPPFALNKLVDRKSVV